MYVARFLNRKMRERRGKGEEKRTDFSDLLQPFNLFSFSPFCRKPERIRRCYRSAYTAQTALYTLYNIRHTNLCKPTLGYFIFFIQYTYTLCWYHLLYALFAFSITLYHIILFVMTFTHISIKIEQMRLGMTYYTL